MGLLLLLLRRSLKMLIIVVAFCITTTRITNGFVPNKLVSGSYSTASTRPAFITNSPSSSRHRRIQRMVVLSNRDDNENNKKKKKKIQWKKIFGRKSDKKLAGSGKAGDKKTIIQRIKSIHNPITYLLISLIAGFRWDWCFRNPYYWFGVAFCIKWYRAKYVFKIPVWDRQPNWNNIITSKEQEKDLKALTCKNCGSTLFIAKTREFFFEGGTGLAGLGCFSCGAKGKDNFIEDRDRIVEDVGDMDDYFEYERPLDFVSRAERRKILKEAQGDEDKANQLLLERQGAGGENDDGTTTATTADADGTAADTAADITADDDVNESNISDVTPEEEEPQSEQDEDTETTEAVSAEAEVTEIEVEEEEEPADVQEEEEPSPVAEEKPKKPSQPPPVQQEDEEVVVDDDDFLDVLDMD